MKKALLIAGALIFLIGCSKKNEYTTDLTGNWSIYKITRNSFDQASLVADSFQNYNINFQSGGQYVEQNVFGGDTSYRKGTWAFQNNYGQLVLTDTARKAYTYTILNLSGNHVELLRDKENRYMRKLQ